MASIVPDRIEKTLRWEQLHSWAIRTHAEILTDRVECAGCHKVVLTSDAWTTTAIGVHGDDLPVTNYIHCGGCMMRMSPGEAWLLAKAEMQGKISRSVPRGTEEV